MQLETYQDPVTHHLRLKTAAIWAVLLVILGLIIALLTVDVDDEKYSRCRRCNVRVARFRINRKKD